MVGCIFIFIVSLLFVVEFSGWTFLTWNLGIEMLMISLLDVVLPDK